MTESSLDRDTSSRPRTSSFCSTGACVGVSARDDVIDVIDTKYPARSISRLTFTREEWAAFVAGVKAGEFDVD